MVNNKKSTRNRVLTIIDESFDYLTEIFLTADPIFTM